MPTQQTLDKTDDVSSTGAVTMPNGLGDSVTKIPMQGRRFVALTSITKSAGASPSATIKVKGTNNPSASSTDGEDLITNTHAAADQQDARADAGGYDYVFVQVTGLTDLTVDRLILSLTGPTAG